MTTPLERLLEVMRRLRDPDSGCPWDRAQDFASIAPHTLEEAFEVVDAIARGEPAPLRDELGDLLFQIVFHAQLAAERGWFDFDAVATGIADKLVRRHPHVFAGEVRTDASQLNAAWENAKAIERAAAGTSGALAGVALALPALVRASKLGRRAARQGFDWQHAGGVRVKVAEELDEVDRAVSEGETHARIAEELGDLLFATANWARHLGVDAEQALRDANRKFETRFALMEAAAAASGTNLAELTPVGWEALWNAAKRRGK